MQPTCFTIPLSSSMVSRLLTSVDGHAGTPPNIINVYRFIVKLPQKFRSAIIVDWKRRIRLLSQLHLYLMANNAQVQFLHHVVGAANQV